MKQELTEDQKKMLKEMKKEMPPEDAFSVVFKNIFSDNSAGINIDQDSIAVIRKYLDLIEEKMNG